MWTPLDFATWVEAGSEGLGWEPGTFLDAYVANRRAASATVIDSTYVGQFIPILAESGFTGTDAHALGELARVAGPDAQRHRGWPATPAGLHGILRRLAPPLAEQGIVIEFLPPATRGAHPLVRIVRAVGGERGSGSVVPFPTSTPSKECEQVAAALRAAGVDTSWPVTKAATLALQKTGGNVEVAAAALNAVEVPTPAGGAWTPEILLAVI